MSEYLHHHRYYLRKKYVHRCTLPKTENLRIEEYYPHALLICRKFVELCLLTNDVSRRQIYSKSLNVLEKERKAQLRDYNFVIHPFSDLAYYNEILMILTYIVQLFVTPLLMIARPQWIFSGYFILGTQILCTLNIIICCFTGHYRPDIKEVILNRSAVMLCYLKSGYLIVQIIGALPLAFISYQCGHSVSTLRIVSCLMAFNICPLMRYIETIRLKRGYSFMIFRLLAAFLVYMFGIVWLSLLIFVGAHLDSLDKDIKYNVQVWWWVYKTYTFMYGSDIDDFCFVGFEFLISTVAIIFGILIRNVILVQLIIMFKTWYSSERKRACLFKELNEFCHHKRLPYNLKKRLIQYYKFKLHDVYYNESEIKTQLSENLRYNIKDYICRAWFQADIFRLCPLALRQLITIHLEEEIYFKNDVIYRAGDPYEYIYFIKSGSVIRTRATNEVYEVVEGNFFAEKTLIKSYDRPHSSTMVAIEDCQMFKLSRWDFFRIIQNFQPSYAIILDILETRTNYLFTDGDRLKSRLQLADYYHTARRSTETEMFNI